MKICVLSSAINKAVQLPPCDLAIFPFGYLGDVDYESELSCKTDKFEKFAKLSLSLNCAVMCGCVTDSRGIKRRSVAVADKGKLVGISDMLHVLDGEDVKGGAYLSVFSLGGYKVGLCIENDIYFPDDIKSLSLMGCNLICVHSENLDGGILPLLMRAYAFLYGVPMVAGVGKVAYFADMSGAIALSRQKISVFETDAKNCYRVISSRRRGLFKDFSQDY
jgi:predicted amidohydrolase